MFNKHPKGLIAASFANLGERFGFFCKPSSDWMEKRQV